MKPRIGVMGSSQGPTIENQENIKKSIEVGHHIAKNGGILLNGACPGLPDEAAYGAHQAGGFVIGISPAFSEEEHLRRYKSPKDYYDVILYTGMGLMERDIINIRGSDAIILLGGGIGTLNEFTVAYDEGKVIGVLTGTGGVSNHIPEIVQICNREVNERIVFDGNPESLVKKVLDAMKKNLHSVSEDQRITG